MLLYVVITSRSVYVLRTLLLPESIKHRYRFEPFMSFIKRQPAKLSGSVDSDAAYKLPCPESSFSFISNKKCTKLLTHRRDG